MLPTGANEQELTEMIQVAAALRAGGAYLTIRLTAGFLDSEAKTPPQQDCGYG